MIKKLTHILVMCIGVLTCSPEFDFKVPGAIPFASGVVQPFASSSQYDFAESDVRQQQIIDERLDGTRSAPAGGAGLAWTLRF